MAVVGYHHLRATELKDRGVHDNWDTVELGIKVG